MEKAKQHIESQNLRDSSISGKYLYWILIIYGLVSFLRVTGIGFTYVDYLSPGNVYVPFTHNLGNFLFILSTVFTIPSLLITFIIERVAFSIILVPILYVLLPLLQILMAFISLSFFSAPLYNSEFSNTFLVRVMMNNSFVMIYYLSIVFYSILIIKRLNINR